MASPRDAILIDDDEGNVGDVRNSRQRSRSASIISTASTCTLHAESPEQQIPNISRLSVEASREPQLYRTGIFENAERNRRKRGTNEAAEHGGPRQRRRLSLNDEPSRVFIDLEEDEVEICPYNEEEDKLIDLDDIEDIEAQIEEEDTQERNVPRNQQSPRARGTCPTRNAQVTLPVVEIDSHTWNVHFLKAGKTVELVDGSFLKIKALTKDLETDEVLLRGWQLKRSKELGGILPMKVNELCFVFEIDLEDGRPCWEQSVLEVGLDDIKQVRKLVCTNRPFPKCRFVQKELPPFIERKAVMEHIEKCEVLVARWKFTTKFDGSRARLQHPNKPNKFRRRQLETLSDDECTKGQSIPASVRRYRWRGETVLGGSGKSNMVHAEQVYTYGDCYSGAGGTMRGALMANLKLKWGLDFNPDACATLVANFQGVRVFKKWVHMFVALPDPLKQLVVDILHLSPPCQVFSPLHTCPGKDDEMNFASLFGVQELIKKARPRIVTLEQTFGIVRLKKFRNAFNQLIRMFTDNGYSTSWQVVEFERFGLSQSRKRLIIVAVGPGETLPEFPSYTHSDNRSDGLKPYNSVRNVLRSIPRNATQNNPAATSRRKDRFPWDDSTIANCITTQGGDRGHPSGTRGFTFRELAALQGFPHCHFFTGNTAGAINKQIGNAVPPFIAEIIFRSIVKHLKKVDAAEKRRGVNR